MQRLSAVIKERQMHPHTTYDQRVDNPTCTALSTTREVSSGTVTFISAILSLAPRAPRRSMSSAHASVSNRAASRSDAESAIISRQEPCSCRYFPNVCRWNVLSSMSS